MIDDIEKALKLEEIVENSDNYDEDLVADAHAELKMMHEDPALYELFFD